MKSASGRIHSLRWQNLLSFYSEKERIGKLNWHILNYDHFSLTLSHFLLSWKLFSIFFISVCLCFRLHHVLQAKPLYLGASRVIKSAEERRRTKCIASDALWNPSLVLFCQYNLTRYTYIYTHIRIHTSTTEKSQGMNKSELMRQCIRVYAWAQLCLRRIHKSELSNECIEQNFM